MPEDFKPKILRGAFVEYGLNIPPLIVPFQFNPEQLTRSRSLSYAGEEYTKQTSERNIFGELEQREVKTQRALRETHEREGDLSKVREKQHVTVNEETISFDIRLDATDAMNEGDPIAGTLGISPRLSTLELMVMPKEESLLGAALESLISQTTGFSFTKSKKPPLILFIWGRTRILPVNITSMNITESEFNTQLSPVRATVSVSMTAIEGINDFYKVTMAAREAMSLVNLANVTDVADVVIPG